MGLIAEEGENVIHTPKVFVDKHLEARRSYPLQAREPITEGSSRQVPTSVQIFTLR